MNRPTVKPKSLRPKDAAAFLGIGESTYWRWHKTRPDFPKMRKLSGRCSIVDADALASWRDAQPSSAARATEAA